MSAKTSTPAKLGVVLLLGGAALGILHFKKKEPPKPAPTETTQAVTDAKPAEPSQRQASQPKPAIDPHDPAIVDAATAGDLAKVKALHEKGVPLDGLLGVAARSGNAALVQWLLDSGVDVHEGEGSPLPPLLEADKHPEVVKLLLAKGAAEPPLDDAIDAAALNAIARIVAKETPSHADIVRAIDATARGDAKKDTRLLTAVFSHGAHVDGGALVEAIMMGDANGEAIVDKLLTFPLEKDTTVRAIDAATTRGDAEMVKKLAKKGVSWTALDKVEQPALVKAAHGLDLDVAKALLEAGAPPDQTADDGESALVAAMRPTVSTGEERIEDMVKLLLAHGASPNRGAGPGMKPLDVAEDAAYEDVAKVLKAHGARNAHAKTE